MMATSKRRFGIKSLTTVPRTLDVYKRQTQLRGELREKGLKRARQFDAAGAVAKHAELFAELLAA